MANIGIIMEDPSGLANDGRRIHILDKTISALQVGGRNKHCHPLQNTERN